MRGIERGLVERVEAALETVVLLAHAAHDRYTRRGYRRMAARADAILEVARGLQASVSTVLTAPSQEGLLYEIREELRLRAADGLQAAEIRGQKGDLEVLLVGARLRHGGGPPRRWVPAERTLRRLQQMAEVDTPVERLQDRNLASLWSVLIGPPQSHRDRG